MNISVVGFVCMFVHVVGTRVILVENAPTCFRRVLAGRRALRSHVRRVVDCERLEDCRRECATEKRFHCESFNYRLDTTFQGKGLCELMTKPIEAFDIRNDFVDDKDYDFFELDRNSLEPNCPETLRGPGLLHSGYLSSKGGISDRIDWNGYRDHNRYDEKRHYNQKRRYENYVPYQIGYGRVNDNENWGQYGGNYGGNSYYKDRSDFHKSYNHWRLSDSDRHVKIIKDFNYHNLGRHESQYGYGNSFKHSGYASGYDDSGRNRKYSDHEVLGRHDSRDDFVDLGKHFEYSDHESNGRHDSQFEYEDSRKHGEISSGLDSLGMHREYGTGYGSSGADHQSTYGNWRKWSGESHSKWDEATFEGRSEDSVKDCSSRRSPGMSLGSGAIRRSLYARTVLDCEAACFGEREFKCVSYSYRYSSPHSSDNCFLSERPYKGLDMSADSDSDVYAMPLHQGCHTVSTKPWVESECFWHVRSGSSVAGTAVKAALTVTGLGACEAECIRAHSFFCRGFSFRFESAIIGDDIENCILTSSPPTSLENGRGLRPSGGHELYARGNYGRGCEPAIYDDVQHRDAQCYLQYDSAARLTPNAVRGRARVKDDKACGKSCNEAPFKCLSFSFNNKAPPHIENCLLSEIRLFDLQRGVDYEHSADDLLYAFDLFNGQCWKKAYGKFEVPTLEVPRPLSASSEEHYIEEPPSAPGPYIASGPSGSIYSGHEPPEYFENGPSSKPDKPYIDTSYRPIPYKPIPGPVSSYLPDSEPSVPLRLSTVKPYYVSEPYLPSYPGYKPEPNRPFRPNRPKPVYLPEKPYQEPQRPSYGGDHDLLSTSWRQYTVSGFPCRRGTTCEQNRVAGHWACEPEGGEIGSWDYCCSPTHRCGYSEGFRKPWCFVGPTHEQWRPCSEKYYPYYQHNVPHPSLGHREAVRPRPDRPVSRPQSDRFVPGSYLPEADRRYWDDLYRDGPKAYYDKYGNPLPGYSRVPPEDGPYIKYERNPSRPSSGNWVKLPHYDEPQAAGGLGIPRYWPIAYLHKDSPPNSTYFRFNETSNNNESENTPDLKNIHSDRSNNDIESRSIEENHRNQKHINVTQIEEDDYELPQDKSTTLQPESPTTSISTTSKLETTTVDHTTEKAVQQKTSQLESPSDNYEEDYDIIKGIDGKLNDFTTSIEVFNLDDAKTADKNSDVKTLEAEERQIEAIGRLLAAKRGGKLISKTNLSTKNIAVDKDFMDFNFNNRFPTERRGTVKKISKEELKKEISNDKSLEVSETTYVRPPRVLTTTENIRKAIVNGKVFYDATIRDQRELFLNSTRKAKSLRIQERSINSSSKKNILQRNVNPVRRVKRVYKKRYNPDEVRKRLLEREKNKTM
ncbi:uncharacterized protein LOC126968291 isoform X2 [Leptidea sinapis]|uniref:uncharacterized protein LOC126968291 isoform X2 n=1 Tax=Leptidea sinapis TaxID=189913 RepID=UPI0021C4B975|nr:uncharacterized protein LOC126968291 isoform X2 [Leptidea sinapis]